MLRPKFTLDLHLAMKYNPSELVYGRTGTKHELGSVFENFLCLIHKVLSTVPSDSKGIKGS